MINRIFADSSILVEFIKGKKEKLLNNIISKEENVVYVNETVVSEFLLYFIAVNGNASPRSLQTSGKISSIFQTFSNYDLLKRFLFLSNNDQHIFPCSTFYEYLQSASK
ncbi:MAG: hypothetical protein ACR2KZ_07705 [Segetibacter sp.]